MSVRSRHSVVFALLAIACVQWGCAVSRDRLGTIGVVSATDAPKADLDEPGHGAAAGRGAAAAAGRGVVAGAMPGLGVARVGAALAQIPVVGGALVVAGLGLSAAGGIVGGALGAIGGAIHAAASAPPPSKDVEATLERVVAEPSIREALRQSVLDAATRQSGFTLVPLQTGRGSVDTILDVSLRNIELQREGTDTALVVSARAQLRRAADGRNIARHSFTHTSVARPYAEWAAHDAAHFRDALATASASMAVEIIDVMLVRPPAPSSVATSPALHGHRRTTNFGRR